MSEPSLALRRSPIDGPLPLHRPDRAGQVGVTLHVSAPTLVLQTSTWVDGVAAWEQALDAALGPVPRLTGETARSGDQLLLRVGPEELWMVSDDASAVPAGRVASLRAHVTAKHGSVTDLSHARIRLSVSGPRCVEMLAKLYALDFRAHAFAPGRVMLSGHHHVPCALHRSGPASFDAYLFTTYARDQFETYVDAALEYGVKAD